MELMTSRVEAVGAGILVEALFAVVQKTNSLKARQNCIETPPGRRMLDKIKAALRAQPGVDAAIAAGQQNSTFGVNAASKACYALAKCDIHDELALEGAVRTCQRTRVKTWPARSMAYLLSGLAKSDKIENHRDLVSACVKELVGGRLRELDTDAMAEMLCAVAVARRHTDGPTETIRRQPDDEKLFEEVGRMAMKMMNQFQPRQLSELVHNYALFGMRNNDLFRIAAPRVLELQNKMSEFERAQAIKAYARFGIPLREQTAKLKNVHIVTGDFQRPSDPPPKRELLKANKEHAIPYSKALMDTTSVKSYD